MVIARMGMILRPVKRVDAHLEVWCSQKEGSHDPHQDEDDRTAGEERRVSRGGPCHPRTDFEDENTFLLLGEWSSPEALQDHICRDHIRALLVAMDLLAEPPDVKFIHVAHTAGMEAIAAARNGLRQTSDERSQKMGI